MTGDDRIEALAPRAAALVCAVADHDRDEVAGALAGLEQDDLTVLAILLAANVRDDSPLSARPKAPEAPNVVAATITARAAEAWHLPADDLLGRSRDRTVHEARAVAMAAMRLAGLTSVFVGEHFGRDHSTVLYAAGRVGEDARLQKAARRLAAPYAAGWLGDETDDTEEAA